MINQHNVKMCKEIKMIWRTSIYQHNRGTHLHSWHHKSRISLIIGYMKTFQILLSHSSLTQVGGINPQGGFLQKQTLQDDSTLLGFPIKLCSLVLAGAGTERRLTWDYSTVLRYSSDLTLVMDIKLMLNWLRNSNPQSYLPGPMNEQKQDCHKAKRKEHMVETKQMLFLADR